MNILFGEKSNNYAFYMSSQSSVNLGVPIFRPICFTCNFCPWNLKSEIRTFLWSDQQSLHCSVSKVLYSFWYLLHHLESQSRSDMFSSHFQFIRLFPQHRCLDLPTKHLSLSFTTLLWGRYPVPLWISQPSPHGKNGPQKSMMFLSKKTPFMVEGLEHLLSFFHFFRSVLSHFVILRYGFSIIFP